MNNWQEWIAGTNPTNATSVLRMVSATNSPSVQRSHGKVSTREAISCSAAINSNSTSPNPLLGGEGSRRSRDGFGAVEVAQMLLGIRQEIAAVRSEFVEVRSAKERLEKMMADGLFAFTRKVDATSFKVLCTVLAEGDVAKASRTLRMPDGTIRTLMRRWRGMGKEYRAMLDLVRWRKAVGRKETVPLNDQVVLGQAKREDYPGLIADVLEKVTEMTGNNWEEKAKELEGMRRAVNG